MKRLSVLLMVCGVSSAANASMTWVHAQSVVANSHVSLMRTPTAVGVAFNILRETSNEKPKMWGVETWWSQADFTLRLSGSRSAQLVRWGILNLAWQVGLTSVTTVAGPWEAGAGVNSALYLGLGGETFEAFIGPSIGGEVFFKALGARMTPRGVLGLRSHLGLFRIAAVLSGGADFERDYFPTFRGDATLMLGLVF